jgi:uncharacterized protein YbaR (Trm112 family)/ubiquinone/menaquinone biosynthesis C-methylase UbiE
MSDATFQSLLQCPRCGRAAIVAAEHLGCRSCGAEYPIVGGIPWLFADPAQALGDWRNRLTQYLEEFAAAARSAEADLAVTDRVTTRARLGRLRDGYLEQLQLVSALLEPLRLVVPPLAQATQQAVATRLPLRQDLHSYYANVHRDWCWGAEENQISAELVAAALGSGRDQVLVLGAGACRLAYDLHQSGRQTLTVALDINPLLLLAARRILAGQTVTLVEFPLAPRRLDDVAVRRELRAPAPVRPGLELVFADAWRAPFKAQSFDAVITPWLVDIVELDFASIALHVNRLLAPGGRWVNFGSLAFPWRRPALRLSPEELAPALTEAGFSVEQMREATVPYMRSPASRHSRLEEVLVFAADKRRRAPREPVAPGLPAWFDSHRLPVPRLAPLALAAEASRIQAAVLALVDGKRSIDDLVRIVSEQGVLPADQARSAVRGLLERLYAAGERA